LVPAESRTQGRKSSDRGASSPLCAKRGSYRSGCKHKKALQSIFPLVCMDGAVRRSASSPPLEETLSCDVVGTGDAVGQGRGEGNARFEPQPWHTIAWLVLSRLFFFSLNQRLAAKQVPVRHCGSSPLHVWEDGSKPQKDVGFVPPLEGQKRYSIWGICTRCALAYQIFRCKIKLLQVHALSCQFFFTKNERQRAPPASRV